MPPPRDPIKYASWIEKQKVSHVGKQMPEGTGKKIGDALRNKPKPKFTQEHCDNISKSKMGKKNPMYGKHIEHVSEDMKCPLCGSRDVKKNGKRKLVDETTVLLAKCNKCGYGTNAKYFK